MSKFMKKKDIKNEEEAYINPSFFVQLLLKSGTYLQREGNRIVGEYGIKQQQFVVLNEIVRKGPLNQKELVGELLFEKSNISKIIKALVKKDLVEVELSEDDRRITVLTCTPEGFSVWHKCMEIFNEWSVSFTSILTKKDVKETIRIIEKLLLSRTEQ